MRAHRKHRGHGKYQGDPQKASIVNPCTQDCNFNMDNICRRYRPCERITPAKTFKVELTPSYEVKGGLWVDVDGVYHICELVEEKLSPNTLCGLLKIGYGRDWAYRLVAGSVVCRDCAVKGTYTNNPENNMQNVRKISFYIQKNEHGDTTANFI